MPTRPVTWLRRLALGAIVPAALVALWAYVGADHPVVPSVGQVADVLAHPFRRPPDLDAAPLASGVTVTLLRVVLGFALAVASGIPTGLLVGGVRPVRDALSPALAAATTISPIAWIPVAIIVFGLASPASVLFGPDSWRFGLLEQLRFAIIAVIWYGGFFPIVLNTAAGVAGVKRSHIEAVRVLGAGPAAVLGKVILPSALPEIITGLRLGVGIAWRVIIAAEIFPGTRSGLGYMIAVASAQGEYQYVFAGILIIAAIGIVLDGVFRLLARRVGRWKGLQR
jgi:NitT/TauT family transport system permease protein